MIPLALFIVALVLGLVVEAIDRGKNLLGWGLVAIALGLLWGHF